MRGWIAFAAFALAQTASAAGFRAAPVKAPASFEFVPAFLGSMSLSLSERPFYASELLGAFDRQLSAIESLPDPDAVARTLQSGIEGGGRERKTMAGRAGEFGAAPVPSERAAAILAANALSRPDQFQRVVNGLEELQPGLGTRVSEALRESGRSAGAQPGLVRLLRQAGETITPQITNGLYNAKGELERLFDGR